MDSRASGATQRKRPKSRPFPSSPKESESVHDLQDEIQPTQMPSDAGKPKLPLLLRFPFYDSILVLLSTRNLGTGFIHFIRHRIVQLALRELGLTITSEASEIQFDGDSYSVSVDQVVCTWAGSSSVKSYRNMLKRLKLVEKMACITNSDEF